MFYSPYFTFNGTHCLDMGVRIVSFSSDVLNEVGINYKEDVVVGETSKNSFFYRKKTTPEPITVNLALVDNNENPLKWDYANINKITRWLLKPYFCEFTSEDTPELIYYFKCLGITKKLNHNKHGVLEVTFQPESNYGLTSTLYFSHICHEKLDTYIDNVSNIGENYFPKIEIIQHSKNKDDIIINNKDVSKEPLVVKNLEYGEKVTIDNQMKTIESSLGVNRLNDINRSWIELKYGINNFSITGECQINIVCQFPMII